METLREKELRASYVEGRIDALEERASYEAEIARLTKKISELEEKVFNGNTNEG